MKKKKRQQDKRFVNDPSEHLQHGYASDSFVRLPSPSMRFGARKHSAHYNILKSAGTV